MFKIRFDVVAKMSVDDNIFCFLKCVGQTATLEQ